MFNNFTDQNSVFNSKGNVYQKLSENLVLRSAGPTDISRIAAFNVLIHEDERIGRTVEKLLLNKRPRSEEMLYLLVEDLQTGQIASSSTLVSHRASYAGITLGLGIPEFVGTHPDYRNKGLVAAQFEVLKTWCENKDLPLQIIAGIPYYYRQFGYEMTLNLGYAREISLKDLPNLTEEQKKTFSFHPALAEDIPFLQNLHRRRQKEVLFSIKMEKPDWRYLLAEKDREDVNGRQVLLIKNAAGEPAGMLIHTAVLEGSTLTASVFEIDEKSAGWHDILPPTLHYLAAAGIKQNPDLSKVGFMLPLNHPVYTLSRSFLPEENKGYAWYVRVSELPLFLQKITPALNERLEHSAFRGHSTEIFMSFYKNGLKLCINKGLIREIQNWNPQSGRASASFPAETFLHLLFGHRSIDELQFIYPDCMVKPDVKDLLEVLFPKQPSWLMMTV